MRIGLDARYLTHPQEGGFKTYTQGLISAIARVDRTNDYVLYTDRPSNDAAPNAENFRVRVTAGSLPVREQLAMPIALARDRVDIAHFLCNTAPLLVRCPLVLTIHDVIPCLPGPTPRPGYGRRARLLERYWKEIIPLAAAKAARIVTVSESSAEDIENLFGASRDRIEVLHNGIDASFGLLEDDVVSRTLERYRIRFRRFAMGFLSRDARKNSLGLLAAYKRAAALIPDCGLVLVCGSRDAVAVVPRDALRDPRIVVVRNLPREDLVALYNATAVFVFPSYAEGFGLPIVEAMACGTPVITSDVGSMREVAGDAAVLVDPGDTVAIARAIYDVLSGATLRERLRALGLRRAGQFSWDETARRLIRVYAQVAGAGGRAVSEPAKARLAPETTEVLE